MGSFTEKEILAVLNDMGYDLSSEELIFFKKGMFIVKKNKLGRGIVIGG